jgi:hypothetical protein
MSPGNPTSTDLYWINRLAFTLSSGGRGEALQSLAQLLIAEYIVAATHGSPEVQNEEAISEELNERLRSCRSDTAAGTLFSMAAQVDPDCDEALFPDGREEMIFISDPETEPLAECLLERYLDYIDTYSDYDLIHPSDFGEPKEADEEKEWERLVNDFACMLREWRNDFFRKLIEDLARKADGVTKI